MKNIKSTLNHYWNKLKVFPQPVIPKWVLLSLIVLVGVMLFAMVLRTFFYKDPIYLSLPNDTTVFALELKVDPNKDYFKALSRKMGLPNALFFTQIENFYFEQLKVVNIPVSALNSKVVSIQVVDSELYPVIVYDFKSTQFLAQYSYFPGFSHFKKANKLYLSTNKVPLQKIITANSLIFSSSEFRNAYINLPKNNIADLYLNHSLLADQHIKGIFSVTESLNKTMSVTVASLRETKFGLILSTYTTPQKGLVFPYSRAKYNALIPSTIPLEQEIFLGGVGATSRIIGLLKNLPEFNQQTSLVSNKIFSLLNTYNLSIDALKLLTKVFELEYGLALNQDDSVSFVFQTLTTENQQILKQELNNLTAFFNPKKISYLLEDGQVARQLVPNPIANGKKLSSGITQFNLNELNINVFYGSQPISGLSYISTTNNPFNSLQIIKQNLIDDRLFSRSFALLQPLANEVVFIRSSFYYKLLKDKFDYKDIPTTFTATNFFHDGIQTVTTLQW